MTDKDKIVIPSKLRRDNSHDEDDDKNESNNDDNSETVINIPNKNDDDADSENNEKESLKEKNVEMQHNSGPWNYRMLLLLQKIGKKTMGFRWMHDQESKINNTVNKKYMIADIVLKVITGLLTGSTIGTLVTGSNNSIVLYIFTGISLAFQLVAGIITAIRESNDYGNVATQHNSAAAKFGEINLEIQYQLSLDIEDREQDKDFLRNTVDKFNNLKGSIPPISETVKKKFIASDEDNEIYNPIIIGDYDHIQLDKKNEHRKIDEETGSKTKYEIDRWLSRF